MAELQVSHACGLYFVVGSYGNVLLTLYPSQALARARPFSEKNDASMLKDKLQKAHTVFASAVASLKKLRADHEAKKLREGKKAEGRVCSTRFIRFYLAVILHLPWCVL